MLQAKRAEGQEVSWPCVKAAAAEVRNDLVALHDHRGQRSATLVGQGAGDPGVGHCHEVGQEADHAGGVVTAVATTAANAIAAKNDASAAGSTADSYTAESGAAGLDGARDGRVVAVAVVVRALDEAAEAFSKAVARAECSSFVVCAVHDVLDVLLHRRGRYARWQT